MVKLYLSPAVADRIQTITGEAYPPGCEVPEAHVSEVLDVADWETTEVFIQVEGERT